MQRFLIIRSGNIGDTIWATTFVDAIYKLYGPEVEIDWVAKGFACSLFKHDPRIKHIHVLQHRRLGLRWSKAKRRIVAHSKLRPYDVLINAETAEFFYDLVRAVEAKYKIGPPWRMPPPSDQCPVDGFNSLLQQLPQEFRPQQQTQRFKPILYPAAMIPAVFKLPAHYIVLTPATSNSAKGRNDNRIWPLEHWRELLQLLAKKYNIIILGATADLEFIQRLGKLPDKVINLVGKTTLDISLAIIQRADLLVAADTGTTHMAAALGVPLVALYGPSNPRITGPYVEDPAQASLFSCYLDNGFGPYMPDMLVDEAMRAITPGMLLQRIQDLVTEKQVVRL